MESIDGYVKNKYIDKNLQINNNINNQIDKNNISA